MKHIDDIKARSEVTLEQVKDELKFPTIYDPEKFISKI